MWIYFACENPDKMPTVNSNVWFSCTCAKTCLRDREKDFPLDVLYLSMRLNAHVKRPIFVLNLLTRNARWWSWPRLLIFNRFWICLRYAGKIIVHIIYSAWIKNFKMKTKTFRRKNTIIISNSWVGIFFQILVIEASLEFWMFSHEHGIRIRYTLHKYWVRFWR